MRSYILAKIGFVLLLFVFTVSSLTQSKGKCIEGNCVNGFGKKDFGNGMFYEGNYRNGKPSPTGKMWANNEKMKIEMKLGKDGIYRGFEEHFGQWKFTGEMRKNSFKGELIRFKDGEKCKYIGIFTPDFIIYGKGSMACDVSGSYKGNYKKGEFHGYGVYTHPDWDTMSQDLLTYKGQFVNGKEHGQGKLYSEKGKLIYAGRWIEGFRYKKIASLDYVKMTMADPKRWITGTLQSSFEIKGLLTEPDSSWDYYDKTLGKASLVIEEDQNILKVWGYTRNCCGVNAYLIYDKRFSALIDRRMQGKKPALNVTGVIIGMVKPEMSIDQKIIPVIKAVSVK